MILGLAIVASLVTGVAANAPADLVEAFEAQACVMTEFLQRLCLTRKECNAGELAAALSSGRAGPRTVFDWAISARAQDLLRTTRLTLWLDYAEHGDFPPLTKEALLKRAVDQPRAP